MNQHQSSSLLQYLLYFLRLGTFGFGGPIVLAHHMQEALVDQKKWISSEDYQQGLAFAQLSPGPLAAQLAMYLGWIRAGWIGAILTGIAFILPSFLMVIAFAALYLSYGNLPWIQALFYAIGAAVIGIIVKSAYQLTKKTIGKDPLLWIFFLGNAIITIWTESEILWIFIITGLISLFIKAPPRFLKRSVTSAFIPAGLLSGLFGNVSLASLTQLFFYFAKVGTVVFGSGLAIVPFLHGGVVQTFHWLNERQFLDAIAVGMITPGPIVITSAFIGYLVAGPMGALLSALGIFLPAYLFIIIGAPYYRRLAKQAQIKAFVSGITSAAIGGITGAAFVLGKKSIVDIPTSMIAFITFVILVFSKRVPEPILILCAGGIGLFLKTI